MKLNWGQSILLFFICYVSFLIFTVFKSRTIDHSLVVENYYDHDITYQKKYDAISNRGLLKQDLIISHLKKEQSVILDFGSHSKNIEGVVTFYRPSDERYDKEESFSLTNRQSIAVTTKGLRKGKWILKINWKDKLRDYYKEKEIYVSNT
ncbi:MAG: FixH family protein [Saprospiraceae bacterium]